MQVFNFTDLARNWSELKHAAARSPVTLAERKRPRFVLMALEDYRRLAGRQEDPRRVFATNDIPEDLLEPVLAGLDRLIEGETP